MRFGRRRQLDDRVKFHNDRLVFNYGDLSRPYGEPDASGTRIVFYEDIRHLNLEPDLDPKFDSDKTRIPVYVPGINRTIVFIHNEWQENSMGPLMESLDGPYLAKESRILIGLRYLFRRFRRKDRS